MPLKMHKVKGAIKCTNLFPYFVIHLKFFIFMVKFTGREIDNTGYSSWRAIAPDQCLPVLPDVSPECGFEQKLMIIRISPWPTSN